MRNRDTEKEGEIEGQFEAQKGFINRDEIDFRHRSQAYHSSRCGIVESTTEFQWPIDRCHIAINSARIFRFPSVVCVGEQER